MRHPHGDTVVLHRFKENVRNAHGQLTKVFHPDEVVEKVAVAPSFVAEKAGGVAERVITQPTIYVGPGLGVGPLDEFTVRGERFGIDGAISGDWVNPFTGLTPGAGVRLKKVTG